MISNCDLLPSTGPNLWEMFTEKRNLDMGNARQAGSYSAQLNTRSIPSFYFQCIRRHRSEVRRRYAVVRLPIKLILVGNMVHEHALL